MKSKIKKIALLLVKILKALEAWVTLPIYAKRNNLAIKRIGKKPVIAKVFDGVFNGDEETERTFRVLMSTIKAVRADFFIIPHPNRAISIAVMDKDRAKVLSQFSGNRELAAYYALIEKDKHNTHVPALVQNGLSVGDPDRILAVSFYRHILAKNGLFLNGENYKVTIEFWSKSEDLPKHLFERAMSESGIQDPMAMEGALVAPIANNVAKVFSSDEQVFVDYCYAGINSKTLEIFTRDLLNKVNYPIDVVYTWVDGNDPVWQEHYLQAKQEADPDYANNSMSRYTDHEELRYSLRSIEMYAPWVRNIYIVTDNQTPAWLKIDENSKVKIIDHRDIFKDESALPVFNSHAIESQLHHIKGLSEHYIYFNDDVLLARDTTPETFFFANGIARVLPSAATIGTGEPSPYESAPSSAGKNARNIVYEKYGRYATNKYRHAPYAQIKSIAEKIERENQDLVDETMRSKFRDNKNIPFTSILMGSYLLATGKGVQAPYRTATVNVSLPDSVAQMDYLTKQRDVDTVCLNESITSKGDEERVSRRIDTYLQKNYPFPSRWENS